MSEPTPVSEILDEKTELLKNDSVLEKGKNGGARPGAGRPPGKLSQKTLDQMKVKEAFNQRVMKHANDLFNAQLSLATGANVLMVKVKERDSDGKVKRVYHEQVTDPELIKQYLDNEDGLGDYDDINDQDHFYYMQVKPPDNKALDSLLNRALGKAPDKLEITGGFFSKSEMTIKVVGSDHDVIDIGDDGQIVDSGPRASADPIGETGPSDESPQPPASS